MPRKQGWGFINHDLFLSNAQIRQVIRSAVDGHPGLGPDRAVFFGDMPTIRNRAAPQERKEAMSDISR
jgi:hypothetical protein